MPWPLMTLSPTAALLLSFLLASGVDATRVSRYELGALQWDQDDPPVSTFVDNPWENLKDDVVGSPCVGTMPIQNLFVKSNSGNCSSGYKGIETVEAFSGRQGWKKDDEAIYVDMRCYTPGSGSSVSYKEKGECFIPREKKCVPQWPNGGCRPGTLCMKRTARIRSKVVGYSEYWVEWHCEIPDSAEAANATDGADGAAVADGPDGVAVKDGVDGADGADAAHAD